MNALLSHVSTCSSPYSICAWPSAGTWSEFILLEKKVVGSWERKRDEQEQS
ncbi:hypothetical protein BCL69_106912 [Nitrosomonas communis]|uniref:Uncharacterized protein n=1 Tax=Nitrosomonas communis TaxID=44574 RepID=A0A5D3Y7X0_9PROT|nr:hypothetical protein BCL69_106912 [Nitrosomonas communis]